MHEYQEPKCFVSSGDPKEFITEFVQNLVSISTKSSSLLREKIAEVFEALETARGPANNETREDRLAKMLVDMQDGNVEAGSGKKESEQETGEDSEDESRGIDVMANDDEEDEEEIESENEEDRAFLDDEVNENDPSFYRRLNVQLDTERRQERRRTRDEIADCEDLLFGEARTKDNKILNELAEKLNAYFQEIPVLVFNSGKYDLNAVKEFLFPYLIDHHPIKFTVKRNSNRMCLKTRFLKLLDISNYVAPGLSYNQFLKAYECEQTKGFFPYKWVD